MPGSRHMTIILCGVLLRGRTEKQIRPATVRAGPMGPTSDQWDPHRTFPLLH